MYKIAIVDDQTYWLNDLKQAVESCLQQLGIQSYVIEVFKSPAEMRRALVPARPFDLVFLDINFPGEPSFSDAASGRKRPRGRAAAALKAAGRTAGPADTAAGFSDGSDPKASDEADTSGLSLAAELRRNYPQTRLVLVSSHEEYVYEGYDVEALYFFVKPAKREKLLHVLKKDYERYQQPKKIQLRLSSGNDIYVHLGGGTILCENAGLLLQPAGAGDQQLQESGSGTPHAAFYPLPSELSGEPGACAVSGALYDYSL